MSFFRLPVSTLAFHAARFLAPRFFLYSFLVVCTLFFSVPQPGAAAPLGGSTPAARIIYTADTLGYTQPCRTCGNASQGGLARRAALLPKLAAEYARPLVIAGPNEFYADRSEAHAEHAAKLAPALHAAFGRMPYTAVYVSPAAMADFQKHGLPLLSNGVAVVDKPITEVFRAGSMVAACVFLPAGTDENGGPTPEQVLAAQAAAREAAPKADVVIGISPWGMRAENFLAPSLAGYFHIILGGGVGIAVPGQASGGAGVPGPLWVRSDRRGRAVTVVDIFSLPVAGSGWLDGIHFSSRLVFLEPELPRDPAVERDIAGLRDE